MVQEAGGPGRLVSARMETATIEVDSERVDARRPRPSVVRWRCRKDHVTRIDVPILGFPLGGASTVARDGTNTITCPQMAHLHMPGDVYETAHPLEGEDWGIYLDLRHYESRLRGIRSGFVWLDPVDYLELVAAVRQSEQSGAVVSIGERTLERILSPDASGAVRRTNAAACETVIALDLAQAEERSPRREISRRRSISLTSLGRRFGSSFGLTVKQFELRARMSRALDRLAEERDIAQIAIDLGFSSHSHFTFMFRQMFGCSPRAARAKLVFGHATPGHPASV